MVVEGKLDPRPAGRAGRAQTRGCVSHVALWFAKCDEPFFKDANPRHGARSTRPHSSRLLATFDVAIKL